jgi:hypothetical protein
VRTWPLAKVKVAVCEAARHPFVRECDA